jgi:hypothetical protein
VASWTGAVPRTCPDSDRARRGGLGRGVPADPAEKCAHADPAQGDAQSQARAHQAFDRVAIEEPWIEVDTTDGYRPALSDIVAFVNA